MTANMVSRAVSLLSEMSDTNQTDANTTFVFVSDDCSAKEEEEKKIKQSLVALGTCLVIVASFISCFGVNLQKWAHNVNEILEPEMRVSMLKNWRWWLGIIAMVLGSIMDMSALPFVPMSRVAALGASTIVANIIITPLFLKEKLTAHDVVGCLITVVGTAVACFFGASGESELNSRCLLLFFTEKLFIAYIICIAIFLAVLFYFIEGYKRMEKSAKRHGIVGGTGQPGSLETVWIHHHLRLMESVPRDKHFVFVTAWGPQFYPAVHAIYAGTIGAQSVMFAKAVLMFFGNALRGVETTASILYLFIFLFPTVFCLWNQIQFLNVALKIYCDAIFVLPVYQAMWIVSGIGSGLIFYQEYKDLSSERAALFSGGVIMCLVGLAILSKRKSKSSAGRTCEEKGDTDNAPPTKTVELEDLAGIPDRVRSPNSEHDPEHVQISFSPPLSPFETDVSGTGSATAGMVFSDDESMSRITSGLTRTSSIRNS